MKAMIFAAGLGTRLLPLTDSLPKALVKINNLSLIEILIERMISFGFNEIIINVHHHADQIIDLINKRQNFRADIHFSDERQQLLDTGGGLLKASWFFNDGKPFIVHNVDVISNLNLKKLVNNHEKSGGLATLAVRSRSSARYLLFDTKNNLCGWENVKTNEKIIVKPVTVTNKFAFSGIQVVDPYIFNLIDLQGKFSIIDFYLKLAAKNMIKAFDHSDSLWMDTGNPDALLKAESYLKLINSTPVWD